MQIVSEPVPAQVAVLDGSCTLTPDDIGGKAWGINRMRALGLPVPPAIVVTTQACREFHANGGTLPDALWREITKRIDVLEVGTGRRFGGAQRPLLVSVRSGAARSMPGMMDTVLNLGINATAQAALAAESGDAHYAMQTHQRFVEQYRKVVLRGAAGPVPDDPWAQLHAAVRAVFASWQSPRARAYRSNRGLSEDACTAVTIQAMVFGNLDQRSGTGVLFSRNPITGDPPAWGEWLPRAQGEDVVAGHRTPEPLERLGEHMPQVHAALMRAAALLEADARDIQDIEFTVESARLWLLQQRVAKRSPQAAVRAAVAFAEEGLISQQQAVHRVSAEQVRSLPVLALSPLAEQQHPAMRGEPACPGVASGAVVTDPEEAETYARRGEDVVLARPTTTPDDLHGIIAARALITEQGGSTSHAAVVSRELGRPCVVGCGSNTVTTLRGQRVTLDGATGRIWLGDLAIDRPPQASSEDLRKLLAWGLPLLPMQILQADEAAPSFVDLDRFGEDWRAALAPGAAVRGQVLDTDEGIRAALAAGVRAAAVRYPLPALLACLSGASTARPAHVPPTPAAGISELTLLRLAGLKGRAATEVLGEALSLPADVVAASYAALCDQGWCARAGDSLRLTHAGHQRLDELLAQERAHADRAAVGAAYEDFCVLNAELKRIMTAWQLKRDDVVNDHQDAAYDHAVLERLADLHRRAGPLLSRIGKLSPRMAAYAARLERAAERIRAGELAYVARLIAESYHTVWFELHEDLISLAGLSREALARAGR